MQAGQTSVVADAGFVRPSTVLFVEDNQIIITD
jgi:hypothetical protein